MVCVGWSQAKGSSHGLAGSLDSSYTTCFRAGGQILVDRYRLAQRAKIIEGPQIKTAALFLLQVAEHKWEAVLIDLGRYLRGFHSWQSTSRKVGAQPRQIEEAQVQRRTWGSHSQEPGSSHRDCNYWGGGLGAT